MLWKLLQMLCKILCNMNSAMQNEMNTKCTYFLFFLKNNTNFYFFLKNRTVYSLATSQRHWPEKLFVKSHESLWKHLIIIYVTSSSLFHGEHTGYMSSVTSSWIVWTASMIWEIVSVYRKPQNLIYFWMIRFLLLLLP